MNLLKLRPQFYTDNLRATIDFYTNYLEFEVVSFQEKWEWCTLMKDGIEWMFTTPPEAFKPLGRCSLTGSIYLDVQDVDECWNRLKDDVNIVYPIEDFEYGMREFAILDNNGYMIQIGMELEE